MVRNGRRLFWGVFALVIIAISAIGGVGYSFWRQVEDQGGLTSFVQDTLNERTRGVVSTIEYARLEFSFSAIPVRLVARNIRLNAADTVLVLPQSEFGFSLSDLMLGQIVPSEMEISGLEIDIEHGGEEWQAGPSVALVTSLLQESQSAPDGADALAAGGRSPLAPAEALALGTVTRRVVDAPLTHPPLHGFLSLRDRGVVVT